MSLVYQATILVVELKDINDVSVTPVGGVTTIEYTMSAAEQKKESTVNSDIITELVLVPTI